MCARPEKDRPGKDNERNNRTDKGHGYTNCMKRSKVKYSLGPGGRECGRNNAR